MRKAAFYTLGCKVNQYETQAMESLFEKSGYKIVEFEEKADVYVINTCTVTGISDRKSRQMIRKAKKLNPSAVVAAVGCYVQVSSDELEGIDEIDVIAGTKDRMQIVELVENAFMNKTKVKLISDIMKARKYDDAEPITYIEKSRAFIKVQDGCDRFCSYCIIPFARGPVRSKPINEILEEVKRLEQKGFREVVVTGIHLASYGKDLKETSLIDLLTKIHKIDGVKRIRLGSVEPGTINQDFVEMLKSLTKVCPHFHISLQSGCNETLKRMNRRYTAEEYKQKVSLLRNHIPDAAVTTDVIVGFPGESDDEFEQTYKFLDEISFSKMHIFKYSKRKGTPAAQYPNQVEPQKKRSKK